VSWSAAATDYLNLEMLRREYQPRVRPVLPAKSSRVFLDIPVRISLEMFEVALLRQLRLSL
jgi:hypothetical protein